MSRHIQTLPQRALLLVLLAGPGWATAQDSAPVDPPPPPADTLDWDDEGWDEIKQWAEETEDLGQDTTATPEAGSEYSELQLVRQGDDGKERRIGVVRKGTDETGIFVFCNPQEQDGENAPGLAVFSNSGPEGVEISIDKNVIQVPLAVVTQTRRADGTSGDGNIEASAGTAAYVENIPEGAEDRLTRCGVQVDAKNVPGSVRVTQGQTQLTGQSLRYSETDGVARVTGPITFKRIPSAEQSGTTELSGTAEGIEVEVDTERTLLVGDVVLNSSGGRVSRAARVEYDDQSNLARLIGTPEQPAVSERGKERLQAAEILYDLERDEAVAWASEGVRITGEFVDEEAAAP
ncbi:LptA/OstA family protein [Deinococcus radiophilus]|uniref:OstA family protein n=1 Tax=Deinococcus radiophilus TaxID=32062 RepID=A0A431VR92_9DEIO|nr:LptA/OstA family protein [Deinococcus radiophilus]RTR25742.1 OstA family protein [Deinococcus radiophilus]UFA50185.1 LptA/OstA family protein [Deinococcus radiophilus]